MKTKATIITTNIMPPQVREDVDVTIRKQDDVLTVQCEGKMICILWSDIQALKEE